MQIKIELISEVLKATNQNKEKISVGVSCANTLKAMPLIIVKPKNKQTFVKTRIDLNKIYPSNMRIDRITHTNKGMMVVNADNVIKKK